MTKISVISSQPKGVRKPRKQRRSKFETTSFEEESKRQQERDRVQQSTAQSQPDKNLQMSPQSIPMQHQNQRQVFEQFVPKNGSYYQQSWQQGLPCQFQDESNVQLRSQQVYEDELDFQRFRHEYYGEPDLPSTEDNPFGLVNAAYMSPGASTSSMSGSTSTIKMSPPTPQLDHVADETWYNFQGSSMYPNIPAAPINYGHLQVNTQAVPQVPMFGFGFSLSAFPGQEQFGQPFQQALVGTGYHHDPALQQFQQPLQLNTGAHTTMFATLPTVPNAVLYPQGGLEYDGTMIQYDPALFEPSGANFMTQIVNDGNAVHENDFDTHYGHVLSTRYSNS